MDIDRALVAVPVGTPYAIEKLLAGQGQPDVAREEGEKVELTRRERNDLAEPARLTTPDVNLEVPHAHDLLRRRALSGAAEDGVDAGDKFPGREGLGQIVVRPELKPEYPIHLIVPCRQEQHRNVAFRPYPPTYIETVELARQADVQNDNPWILLRDERETLIAVAGQQHPKPVSAQVQIDEIGDVGVVLDHHHGPDCAFTVLSLALREKKMAKTGYPSQNPHL
jgi:hypothetical protein